MTLVASHGHKSLPADAVSGIELPTFTILTGPNGSGKSNLLEGIQLGAFTFPQMGPIPSEKIRLFGLGQLLAAAEGPVQGANYREPWASVYNYTSQLIAMAPDSLGPNATLDQIDQWMIPQLVSSRALSRAAAERMIAEAGKPLSGFSHADFREFAPLIAGVKDPFAASIAEVFLSYRERKTQNDMAQWRFATKGEGSALSDEEFTARYGPLPWKLLDETLRLVGLPYAFVPPPEFTETVNYEVQLEAPEGVSIGPGDLSSGERVLLAVAMSLFTGSRLSEAIELPKILLLDEADASLHPSMVKSLLTVIEEIFVGQYGVRVLLATHSPSTVALAPEESLFVMSRAGVRLRKASTDEALKLLTVGISSLSVKLENRRQVFVESEYDQSIYQELFSLTKGRLSGELSAEFVAVGKRSTGGGCDAVVRLVTDLRAAGNDTIYGIVDRDHRNAVPEYVHFVAERYSIENLVLDPLLLGTLLLREKIVGAPELGLPPGVRHFELNEAHAVPIVNAITAKLGYTSPSRTCHYAGGFSVEVPENFLDMRGHDLEAAVLDVYPPLRRFQSGLMSAVVRLAVADVPEFLPVEVLNLLEDLLA
jgi:ABC-type Mn2+/Zn2+ transport system ATPase subunit